MSELLLRRRAAMAKSLPYDAEIEYLESSGTQWIDTGITQNSLNIEIGLQIQWVGSSISLFESFFAYMTNDGIVPRCGIHKYKDKWMFGTNSTMITAKSIDKNIHNIFLTGDSSTQKEQLYLDGTPLKSGDRIIPTGISSNNIHFYMFGRNRNGDADNLATIRIMSCWYKQFTDEGHTTIAQEIDMMPVRVGQVGYMYDKVSGQLFGNQGSGSFILGNDL